MVVRELFFFPVVVFEKKLLLSSLLAVETIYYKR